MLTNFLTECMDKSNLHTELRAQQNLSRLVHLLNGDPIANVRQNISGVCARVYDKGVYGFASSAEYTPSSTAKVLEAAGENCRFLSLRTSAQVSPLPPLNGGFIELSQSTADAEQRLYLELAKHFDDYIVQKCPGLMRREVRVRSQSMEKLIVVNDGLSGHTFHPRAHIYVTMTAESNDGTPVEITRSIGDGRIFSEVFSSLDRFYAEVDDVYRKVMDKCSGVYANGGIKECVFDPSLAGILAHEAVGHTVEGDLVMGGSVALHNLGKPVASAMVNLIDYASTDGVNLMPFNMQVDDEGTPCRDAVLIKDGILVGYMNSRRSAQHFNMEPCGNARAYLFSDEPLIRMRNTAIVPGNDSIDNMIASIDDGYYFSDPSNGQADMTGEFMFGVSMGYEIKNGKIGRAVRDTTISGVAFEMLKSVSMISNHSVWSSAGTCGKKQPMITGMGGPAIKCKINVGGR